MFVVPEKRLSETVGGQTLGECTGFIVGLIEVGGLVGVVQAGTLEANQINTTAGIIQDTCQAVGIDLSKGFIMTGQTQLAPVLP